MLEQVRQGCNPATSPTPPTFESESRSIRTACLPKSVECQPASGPAVWIDGPLAGQSWMRSESAWADHASVATGSRSTDPAGTDNAGPAHFCLVGPSRAVAATPETDDGHSGQSAGRGCGSRWDWKGETAAQAQAAAAPQAARKNGDWLWPTTAGSDLTAELTHPSQTASWAATTGGWMSVALGCPLAATAFRCAPASSNCMAAFGGGGTVSTAGCDWTAGGLTTGGYMCGIGRQDGHHPGDGGRISNGGWSGAEGGCWWPSPQLHGGLSGGRSSRDAEVSVAVVVAAPAPSVSAQGGSADVLGALGNSDGEAGESRYAVKVLSMFLGQDSPASAADPLHCMRDSGYGDRWPSAMMGLAGAVGRQGSGLSGAGIAAEDSLGGSDAAINAGLRGDAGLASCPAFEGEIALQGRAGGGLRPSLSEDPFAADYSLW